MIESFSNSDEVYRWLPLRGLKNLYMFSLFSEGEVEQIPSFIHCSPVSLSISYGLDEKMWQFDSGLNSLDTFTIVSTASMTVLLVSVPSLFLLPTELEKAPDATAMTASVLLSAFGINVAE